MVGVANEYDKNLKNFILARGPPTSSGHPSPTPKKSNGRLTEAADIAFGSIAGFFGKIVEHPFDTIKVRLQTQPFADGVQQLNYRGPVDCARQSIKQDGFWGLYRGISSPLVGSMLENAVLFVAYNQIQKLINSASGNVDSSAASLSLKQKALAGALSGTAVSLVLTPVELVKCQLQVDSCLLKETAQFVGPATAPRNPTNPFSYVENIFLKQRIAGPTGNAHLALLNISLAKNSVNLHALFPNRLSVFAPDLHYNSAHLHYATHPYCHNRAVSVAHRGADIKRTYNSRLVIVHRAEYATSMGAVAMFKLIFQKGGIRGLYTGNVSTILRETAGGAAWFGTYEYAKESFLQRQDRSLSIYETMAAGALAGMAYNAALFPADVIKSRQQALSLSTSSLHRSQAGLVGTAKYIWEQGGIRGFYRGFGITLARSVPASAVIFLSYEMLKETFNVAV